MKIDEQRLRMEAPSKPLNIILVEPEIPQNTGNIARLCAATGSRLHLVGRLGFSLDEKKVRRAGLDYWHLVDVSLHNTLDECLGKLDLKTPILFSAKAKQCYLDAPYTKGAALVFGKETKGLSAEITKKYSKNLYGIPTVEGSVRSLNLANSASIVIYEALRSIGAIKRVEASR